MPSAISIRPATGITRFTNCRVAKQGKLMEEDVWFSSKTGTILSSQSAFFDDNALPDNSIDLGGRIVSPGLIDVQLNGAFGFNFSTLLSNGDEYAKEVQAVNRRLVATGVTSYVPTLTSQKPELYQQVLPYLGPSQGSRLADDGAESLGAHVEGPFLSPNKNGVHNKEVLRAAESFSDIEECYGTLNLGDGKTGIPSTIKKITLAPERGQMTSLIPELRSRGIICSIGHTEATYEEASSAVKAGATMITHLFNAMRPLHHRNPGIFGLLGNPQSPQRPYYGVIADGIHLHPTTVTVAFKAYPSGFILVTDAMHMMGLPDATYEWTNGGVASTIVKKGPTCLLEGTETIAGSSISLIECVNNFLNWSGASIPEALDAVTTTPAKMLQVFGTKGTLDFGADADLVVLSETHKGGVAQLAVDQVWKFGTKVYAA
ncbi:N-acetyl-glucosamine-6-phosphate deacetylase [Fusarium falciforme]|nr:N-acetyl-glucosamine-6-phosphate deacetylase [Fusarium falciforme]